MEVLSIIGCGSLLFVNEFLDRRLRGLVLPSTWRLLGPIESVTGVLMCGLSASGLFAIVTRLVQHEERFLPPLPPLSNAADSQAFTAA